MQLGPALTWDQLADAYGPGDRRLPMATVFNWAASQTGRFSVSEDGTIHEIIKEQTKC